MVRSSDAITLRDVYRAVESSALFPLHPNPPNQLCMVGRTIQDTLARHFRDAQLALEENLERVTIAELVRDMNVADC